MPLLTPVSAFSRVTALAARRPVHSAFAWLHGNPKTIMDWQMELVAIPAPTHGEEARAIWLKEKFLEAGLSNVEIDGAGNIAGFLSAAHLPPESTGPMVLLSAHLDTVFPAGTPIHPVLEDDRLVAPGACDNAAGVAGMLAIASALIHAGVELPVPLVVLGNVGEEGEGDLRGVRHIYQQSPLAGRIAAHIVLDGPGADAAVTQALGSRRFQVTVTGPGGHSFTDAGTPNPIAALATALARLADTPMPEDRGTTLNLGTISGGISVNSIPESAQATIDFRSTEVEELVRLEVALHRAVEDAVEHWNDRSKPEQPARRALVLRRSQRSATAPPRNCQTTPRCSPPCAPSTGTWACVPNFASARPTPTFRFRSAFRRCRWVLAAKAARLIPSTSGTRPKDRELALKRVLSPHPGHAGVGRRPIAHNSSRLRIGPLSVFTLSTRLIPSARTCIPALRPPHTAFFASGRV